MLGGERGSNEREWAAPQPTFGMLKMKNVGNPGAESRVPPWDINSFVKSQLINIIYSPLLAAAHRTARSINRATVYTHETSLSLCQPGLNSKWEGLSAIFRCGAGPVFSNEVHSLDSIIFSPVHHPPTQVGIVWRWGHIITLVLSF